MGFSDGDLGDSGEQVAELPKIESTKDKILKSIGLENTNCFDTLKEDDMKKLLSLLTDGEEPKLQERKKLLKFILENNVGVKLDFADLKDKLELKTDTEVKGEKKIVQNDKQSEKSSNQNSETRTESKESNNDSYKELRDKTNEIYSKLDLSKFPDLNKWQEESKQALLKTNPDLGKPENQDKLADLSKSHVLFSHKEDFLKAQPNLKNDFEGLEKARAGIPELRGVNNARIEKYLSTNTNALHEDIVLAKRNIGVEAIDIKFDGTKIISQVDGGGEIIYDIKNPAYKSLSMFGFSYEVPSRTSIQDLNRVLELERKDTEITGDQEVIKSRQETRNKFPKSSDFKIEDVGGLLSDKSISPQIKGDIEKLLGLKELLGGDLKEYSQEMIDDIKKQIQEITKNLQNYFINYIQETNKLGENLNKKQEERDELLKKDQNILNQDLEIGRQDIQKGKDSLNFLHNIGITFMSQDQFNSLIEGAKSKINSGISGDFSIDKLASQEPGVSQYKYHQDLINFYNKLLGLEGTDAINPNKAADYVNSKSSPFTNPSFEQKVRETLFVKDRFIGKDVLNEKFGQDSKTDSPSEQPNQNK